MIAVYNVESWNNPHSIGNMCLKFSNYIYFRKIAWYASIYILYVGVNYDDLTVRPKPGIMVNKRSHPKMVLFQVIHIIYTVELSHILYSGITIICPERCFPLGKKPELDWNPYDSSMTRFIPMFYRFLFKNALLFHGQMQYGWHCFFSSHSWPAMFDYWRVRGDLRSGKMGVGPTLSTWCQLTQWTHKNRRFQA